MRSSSATGFCVGYPSRSLPTGLIRSTTVQTSPSAFPFNWLRYRLYCGIPSPLGM